MVGAVAEVPNSMLILSHSDSMSSCPLGNFYNYKPFIEIKRIAINRKVGHSILTKLWSGLSSPIATIGLRNAIDDLHMVVVHWFTNLMSQIDSPDC